MILVIIAMLLLTTVIVVQRYDYQHYKFMARYYKTENDLLIAQKEELQKRLEEK